MLQNCDDYDLCGDCVGAHMRLVPRFSVAAGDTHGEARPITAAEWLACDLVRLREAVAGLALSVPGIEAFAADALEFAERNAPRLRELTRLPELTVDQIAAINLYTKQNTAVPDHSLFKLLNQVRRSF